MHISRLSLVILLVFSGFTAADSTRQAGAHELTISNELISFTVDARSAEDLALTLQPSQDWANQHGSNPSQIQLNGGFALDIMWTGWRAPGTTHNAENPISMTLGMFELTDSTSATNEVGDQTITLIYSSDRIGIETRLTFELKNGDFVIRQHLAVRDTRNRNHFLRKITMLDGTVSNDCKVIKTGGFGNPFAITAENGGAFVGIEYPTATSSISESRKEFTCFQEIGKKIGADWQEFDPLVIGLSPNQYVKLWFKKYLETIKVSPAKPYLLYNSWYDVRAPEYTDRPEDVMNEENVLRIIDDFKREMYEKRGIKLDAFLLDDGWDIYKSDWVLRPNEFPNGLSPISDALAELGTDLGIWLGPTGGYSHRDWRINWMREHGYETVNDQFCVAATNYKNLLIKRTTDFVKNHGVRSFKWDGIQFSCSEPDHGHPIDIYSRRAVMDSVIELADANRAVDQEVHLNITSGTWLSPWWLKYANQIWMQGSDYGYADVPSISKRDSAITYRDVVLYEDFARQNCWFPISHLMTHGIIKGHLQKLGGEAEPLDKFTDNALLYFARGVSMYELYISPNLLTGGEWEAIAKSIKWAKDRFDILKQTEMIGGNPGNGQAYGYVHYSGDRGIVALRNPSMEKQVVNFELSPAHGLVPHAASLVVDKVYPTRYILPDLYDAGSTVSVELGGYETAVFEIFPVESADYPLLADADFQVQERGDKSYALRYYDFGQRARILNPEVISTAADENGSISPTELNFSRQSKHADPIGGSVKKISDNKAEISLSVDDRAKGATLAFLIQPKTAGQDSNDPAYEIILDGEIVIPEVNDQKGSWTWLKIAIPAGMHTVDITLSSTEEDTWEGTMQVWSTYYMEENGTDLAFVTKESMRDRPMPPRAWKPGIFRGETKIGETDLSAPGQNQ